MRKVFDIIEAKQIALVGDLEEKSYKEKILNNPGIISILKRLAIASKKQK